MSNISFLYMYPQDTYTPFSYRRLANFQNWGKFQIMEGLRYFGNGYTLFILYIQINNLDSTYPYYGLILPNIPPQWILDNIQGKWKPINISIYTQQNIEIPPIFYFPHIYKYNPTYHRSGQLVGTAIKIRSIYTQ